jgi:hypothetical protein
MQNILAVCETMALELTRKMERVRLTPLTTPEDNFRWFHAHAHALHNVVLEVLGRAG